MTQNVYVTLKPINQSHIDHVLLSKQTNKGAVHNFLHTFLYEQVEIGAGIQSHRIRHIFRFCTCSKIAVLQRIQFIRLLWQARLTGRKWDIGLGQTLWHRCWSEHDKIILEVIEWNEQWVSVRKGIHLYKFLTLHWMEDSWMNIQ